MAPRTNVRRYLGRLPFHSEGRNEKPRLRSLPAALGKEITGPSGTIVTMLPLVAGVSRAIELQPVRLPLQMHDAENQHFAADSTHPWRAGACRNPVQSRSFA